MRRLLVVLAAGLWLGACAQLSGLDDYAGGVIVIGPGGGGEGAAGGLGGSGGLGGAGGGVAGSTGEGGGGASSVGGAGGGGAPPVSSPHDWATTLEYVFTFENAADIGANSGAMGAVTYSPHPDVTQDSSDARIGSGALSVGMTAQPPARLSYPTVGQGTLAPLTVGAWIYATGDSTQVPTVVGRFHNSNQNGFGLNYGSVNENLSAVVGDGTTTYLTTPGGTAPNRLWRHLTLRVNADGTMQGFLDGQSFNATPQALSAASSAFTIGTTATSFVFVGLIDDVYFHRDALTDDAIERIWACGIDGSRCECDELDMTNYADCGFANPAGGCATLPPCNQPAPQMVP